MNKLEQAARQALEALVELVEKFDYEQYTSICELDPAKDTILILREALDPELQFVRDWNEGKVRRVSDEKVMGFAEQAEPSQLADASLEPVAWGYFDADGSFMDALDRQHGAYQTPLYAASVRKKDLTDDEINALVDSACDSQMPMDMFARAVIAAYKEKNK